MIKQIIEEKRLHPYTTHVLEDSGIEVMVAPNLAEEDFIGIKVDDYYMGLKLGKDTPKAVDFIVSVDCQCDWYSLYIMEFKDIKRPGNIRTKDIHAKFDTAIKRFIKDEFQDIFLNARFKYKDIKLYLVTSAYKDADGLKYEEYINKMKKANRKDTLVYDQTLSSKPYIIRKKRYYIEREIPPNPVIQRIM